MEYTSTNDSNEIEGRHLIGEKSPWRPLACFQQVGRMVVPTSRCFGHGRCDAACQTRGSFLDPALVAKASRCSSKRDIELMDDLGRLHVIDISPLVEDNPPRCVMTIIEKDNAVWFDRGDLHGVVFASTAEHTANTLVQHHFSMNWDALRDGFAIFKSGCINVISNQWGDVVQNEIHLQGDTDDLIIRHVRGPTNGGVSTQLRNRHIRRTGPVNLMSIGENAHVRRSNVH